MNEYPIHATEANDCPTSGQGGKIARGMAVFLLTFFDEFHRKRVNTVPGVFRSVVLAFKHVAQMPVATGTQDFSPKAIRIGELLYSSFNLFIEGWPTAAGIKFTVGIVKWSVTSPANISSRLIKIIVLTCEGRLGPLGFYDVTFL